MKELKNFVESFVSLSDLKKSKNSFGPVMYGIITRL